MRKSLSPYIISVIVLFIALIIIGKIGLLDIPISLVQKATNPVRNMGTSMWVQRDNESFLKEEDMTLRQKIVEADVLQKENKALKDQFETTTTSQYQLLPAPVVSRPSFVPGITEPDLLIVGLGSSSGVKKGQAVVYKDNLVGIIDGVSKNSSKVVLINNLTTSFTARLSGEPDVSGIIKGKGDGISLENLPSKENIKKKTLVVTQGDEDEGINIPPGLIVGEVVLTEKKSSEIFQKAVVESFITFSRMSHVFIVKN